MFNSYKLTFGVPKGHLSEGLIDIFSEVSSVYSFNDTIEDNAKALEKALRDELSTPRSRKLSTNQKACMLAAAFHHANENFYELEDDGMIDDCYAAQDDYLEAWELALKAL